MQWRIGSNFSMGTSPEKVLDNNYTQSAWAVAAALNCILSSQRLMLSLYMNACMCCVYNGYVLPHCNTGTLHIIMAALYCYPQ